MKFHIEVDCTPEEVRRLIGLLDMASLHDVYQTQVKEMMEKGITPDVVDSLIKSWSPMGQNGLDMFRSFMASFGDGAKGSADNDGSKPAKS